MMSYKMIQRLVKHRCKHQKHTLCIHRTSCVKRVPTTEVTKVPDNDTWTYFLYLTTIAKDVRPLARGIRASERRQNHLNSVIYNKEGKHHIPRASGEMRG